MSGPEVLVVRTGTANTASVLAAFRRLEARPRVSDDASEVRSAPFVVLPGVGAFAAATARLDEVGLRDALRRRIEEGRPTLAVCLGLQLLCSGSEESPDTRGLGLVPATVRRFSGDLRVPQLGWNRIEPTPGSELVEPGWAYFAHTYRLEQLPESWCGAITDYGGPFVSALELGSVLACQFHPELSGAWGASLLSRWIQRGLEV